MRLNYCQGAECSQFDFLRFSDLKIEYVTLTHQSEGRIPEYISPCPVPVLLNQLWWHIRVILESFLRLHNYQVIHYLSRY